MNDVTISFGRKVLQAESMRVVLDLERMEGRSSEFNIVDALVGEVLIRSLRGERVVEMISHKDREHTIMLHGLSAEYRSFVEETYRLDRQQGRGAWFLPAEVSLRVGTINLPAFFRIASRFTSSIAGEEHCKVSLGNSASAFFVWTLLEPFFDALFEPFTLRGRLTGNKSREDQLKNWAVIDTRYKALGLELSDELAVMRYGGGWHKLRSQEQMAAKQRLLATLTQQIEPAMVARYRVYCFRSLLEHYYKKANADGRVRRKQALTRSFERTVAGYFGGDWLAFLAYIGEGPHPEEQIVTALPKTRLHVGGASRAEEVASQMGLPAAEVARMMAAYWQQSDGLSPIEQRVDVLRRYWKTFDEIHARQEGGMSPLWGLVEDHRSFDFFYHDPNMPYIPRLYLQLLSKTMLSEIERLWGTMMLPRWPDRIISEPSPHMALVESLGPALKFWHGCALTAWFLCEGPSSRTNMAGLAEYYRREIKALEELGTPIDARLFDELVKVEETLGPPQPLTQNTSTVTGKSGLSITITMTMNTGTKRGGFERLRDIITYHRRLWTEKYFDHYLHTRWETEIREAGRAYNQLVSEMSKVPTPRQFAKVAATATNHWFGGDLSALYGAIREKSAVQPHRYGLLPADRVTFAFSVFHVLGGNPFFRQEQQEVQRKDQQAWRQMWDRNAQLSELAGMSFWYIQLEEGLGRPPDMKEFGLSKFRQLYPVVNEHVEQAWKIYSEAVESAKQGRVNPPQVYQAPETVIVPTREQPLLASPQLVSSSVPDNQPPERKRSWLDRLLGRH